MIIAQVVLSETARTAKSGMLGSLIVDVLDALGDDPIELTRNQEKHVREFLSLYEETVATRMLARPILEQRLHHVEKVMILSAFIQRKR